jgi:hypothetical protein
MWQPSDEYANKESGMAALANQIKTEGEQDLYLPWQGSMQSVGAVGRKNAGFARSNVPATAVNGGSAGWMASDGRRNDRSEWTMLSKHQKNDLHRWVIKLPQTRAGVDTISNLVLGRGMSFIHPERDLKKEYQSLMRRHWDPFGKDLLLYSIVFGLVPVRLVDHELLAKVPVVLDYMLHDILWKVDEYNRYHYRVVRNNTIIEDAMVIPVFRPSADGTMNSPYSSLLDWVRLTSFGLASYVSATTRNLHPNVVLVKAASSAGRGGTGSKSGRGIDTSLVGEAITSDRNAQNLAGGSGDDAQSNAIASSAADYVAQRYEDEQWATEVLNTFTNGGASQSMVSQTLDKMRSNATKTHDVTLDERIDSKVIRVANDYTFSQAPSVPVPQHIPMLLDTLDKNVARVLGLPMDLLSSTENKFANDNDIKWERIEQAINGYASLVEDNFNMLLRIIYTPVAVEDKAIKTLLRGGVPSDWIQAIKNSEGGSDAGEGLGEMLGNEHSSNGTEDVVPGSRQHQYGHGDSYGTGDKAGFQPYSGHGDQVVDVAASSLYDKGGMDAEEGADGENADGQPSQQKTKTRKRRHTEKQEGAASTRKRLATSKKRGRGGKRRKTDEEGDDTDDAVQPITCQLGWHAWLKSKMLAAGNGDTVADDLSSKKNRYLNPSDLSGKASAPAQATDQNASTAKYDGDQRAIASTDDLTSGDETDNSDDEGASSGSSADESVGNNGSDGDSDSDTGNSTDSESDQVAEADGSDVKATTDEQKKTTGSSADADDTPDPHATKKKKKKKQKKKPSPRTHPDRKREEDKKRSGHSSKSTQGTESTSKSKKRPAETSTRQKTDKDGKKRHTTARKTPSDAANSKSNSSKSKSSRYNVREELEKLQHRFAEYVKKHGKSEEASDV